MLHAETLLDLNYSFLKTYKFPKHAVDHNGLSFQNRSLMRLKKQAKSMRK